MMILYVRKSNEGPSTVYSSSGCYHQSPMRQYMTHISSEGFITLLCVYVCVVCSEQEVLGHIFCPYLGTLFQKKLLVGCGPVMFSQTHGRKSCYHLSLCSVVFWYKFTNNSVIIEHISIKIQETIKLKFWKVLLYFYSRAAQLIKINRSFRSLCF